MTNDDIARAFSRHRFEETYDHLADDVVWDLVGEARLEGRDAVVAACAASAAENAEVEVTWLRFVATGDGPVVAVDAIGRYAGADSLSVVSSCDIYEFRGGSVQTITSYAVEIDEAAARR